MQYSVEQIAQAASLSVDTVRFYQNQGLLPAPARQGRRAGYDDEHLERLQHIQELKRRGLKLSGVRQALEGSELEVRGSLLDALADVEGDRSYSRAELATLGGVPEFMIDALEQASLLHPLPGGEPRYTEADLRSLEAGRILLEAGIPLHELLPLAQQHAAHVEHISDQAIALFAAHVRALGGGDADHALADTLRALLPAVSTLVAMHFQRTLIRRTRDRLADSDDRAELEAALAETERARLKLSWS